MGYLLVWFIGVNLRENSPFLFICQLLKEKSSKKEKQQRQNLNYTL
jgi:hypothetical protein